MSDGLSLSNNITDMDRQMDLLIEKMQRLQAQLSGLNFSGASNLVAGIDEMAGAIGRFNEQMGSVDFGGIAAGLNGIANVNTQGISETSSSLADFERIVTTMGAIATIASVKGLSTAVGELVTTLGTALGSVAPLIGLIGVVTAAIAGLYLVFKNVNEEAAKNSAIGQFTEAISELDSKISEKTGQIREGLAKTKAEIETAGAAESSAARNLAAEYESLSSKAFLGAEGKEKLKQVSQNLVSLIPELNKYLNEETGCLDIQKETLDGVINGYESMAQKQAAQEGLVSAYKSQYDAQMNVIKAQQDYDRMADEYLGKAGLTSEAIEEIKNGTLDLSKARSELSQNPDAFFETYGVYNSNVLEKAINGLNVELSEYKAALEDAKKAEQETGAQVEYMNGVLKENEEQYQKSIEAQKAAIMSTTEYKQSLRDLTTELSDMNLNLSEDFIANLALEGFDPTVLQGFFESLAEGVPASAESLQMAFNELGMTLPMDLSNAMAEMEPAMQEQFTMLLMQIQSGVEVQGEELRPLFEELGYDLPGAVLENFATREDEVLVSTVNLLSKIGEGDALVEGNLIELFKGLGLKITDEGLIKTLSEKEADVQCKAIALLGQLATAADSERDPLIQKLNELGVSVANDGLIVGIQSKEEEAQVAAGQLLAVSASSALAEANREGSGTFKEAGQNAVDGYVGKLSSSSALRSVFQAGLNIGHQAVAGVKKGQDSKSPSRKMAQLGLYAVQGFNQGISKNMQSTYDLAKHWVSGVAEVFEMEDPIAPEISPKYSIDRTLFDTIESTRHMNVDLSPSDFTASISADLKDTLSNIVDYDRLSDVLVQRLEQANITAELDSDKAYGNVKNKWKQDVKRTGRSPVPIV